jgi:hypothetical protein
MNDEKRYPVFEEEDGSCMRAGEADYETVAIQRDTSLYPDEEVVYDVAPGTFGFYTDSVEELQRHVAAMEAEINDPNSKWIPSEQMWSEVKQEFPWLK